MMSQDAQAVQVDAISQATPHWRMAEERKRRFAAARAAGLVPEVPAAPSAAGSGHPEASACNQGDDASSRHGSAGSSGAQGSPNPADPLEPLGRFQHGGVLYGREGALDFSASLNPLGMPEAAVHALQQNVRAFESYPDVDNRQLAQAVSAHEGVPEKRICLCAGATDAFDRIADVCAPRSVLLFDPCFSGYERALRRTDAQLLHVPLCENDDFGFTDEVLGRACALLERTGPGLAFLCTPNNPTGQAVPEPFLRAFLDAAIGIGTTVVLDECFADLAGLASAIPLQGEFPNLVVVKAFTKTYAMAGLRLGYAVCAAPEFAQSLRQAGAQWAVSVPAQIAGVAALCDDGYLERTGAYVAAERARLVAALEDAGMRVVPSCANYILFQRTAATSGDADLGGAADLFDDLLDRGIIVRRCGNFDGLDSTWYRIAVRTAEENARFIEALKEVCCL